MRRLLLLRPAPGLSASKARAEALGLEVLACPLFAVVPVDWQAPDAKAFDGVLLTSANAARMGGTGLGHYKSLPVHAVGEATAAAARDAGFLVETVGNQGVDALLASLPDNLRLIHPTGRHRTRHGGRQAITDVIVYESGVVDHPPLPQMAGLVVAVHSPRAGARLAELVEDRAGVIIAAISSAAADACGPGWQRVETAAGPNDHALLALASKLCQTTGA